MINKPIKLFPSFIIKNCRNDKCGRRECHTITTEKGHSSEHYITTIKCMACSHKIVINCIKGGQ